MARTEPDLEPEDLDNDEPGEADAEASRIVSIEQLNQQVRQLIAKVSSITAGSKTGAAAAPAADVGAQVRDEVRKLQAADRSRQRTDRLAELENKVKAIVEKPPVEYRRITRALWGDKADDNG